MLQVEPEIVRSVGAVTAMKLPAESPLSKIKYRFKVLAWLKSGLLNLDYMHRWIPPDIATPKTATIKNNF